ncbi:hypothetical protein [Cupriavidus basilensis]|uniref:hypothetical protein n=1 Tax=Cupriavidus basilensis TaxID=68895 RepID=UPI0020A65C85|nr:hypothetical protein [Cupriavidus basilensis]MCP3024972.1 hypothetical protein [Cupriavidus basilensis]
MFYVYKPTEGELSSPIISSASTCFWVVAGRPRKTLRAAIRFAQRVGGYVAGPDNRIVWMRGHTFT